MLSSDLIRLSRLMNSDTVAQDQDTHIPQISFRGNTLLPRVHKASFASVCSKASSLRMEAALTPHLRHQPASEGAMGRDRRSLSGPQHHHIWVLHILLKGKDCLDPIKENRLKSSPGNSWPWVARKALQLSPPQSSG